MLEKLHKTKDHQDLADAEQNFCQKIMGLQDYGYFFYTGRLNKKTDSPSVFFAVHSTGVYFFEISKNVFKPAKQMHFYAWKNIKEIQYNSNKMQLLLSETQAGSVTRVKIYLAENKAKHIFDMTELYHQQYLLRLQQKLQQSTSEQNNKCSKQETFRDFCRKVKRYTMESTSGMLCFTRFLQF